MNVRGVWKTAVWAAPVAAWAAVTHTQAGHPAPLAVPITLTATVIAWSLCATVVGWMLTYLPAVRLYTAALAALTATTTLTGWAAPWWAYAAAATPGSIAWWRHAPRPARPATRGRGHHTPPPTTATTATTEPPEPAAPHRVTTAVARVSGNPTNTLTITPTPGPLETYEIDLNGAPAADVIRAHERLAAALRLPTERLLVDRGPHASALHVTILDRPLRDRPATDWPLLDTGETNMFQPIPFAVSDRMEPVTVTLAITSVLVASIPRVGKSFAIRLLLAAAALDPRTELHIHCWKGSRDYEPFAPIAHYLGGGSTTRATNAATADLRAVLADVDRRYDTLKRLPTSMVPDSQVTDALASDPTLGLHPVVVAWDEFQLAYSTDRTLAADIERLVRVAPAVNVTVILATQRPDADSVPPSLSDNIPTRIAFATETPAASNLILGPGAHGRGVSTSSLTQADKGVCWVKASGVETFARTYRLDLPTTEQIVARARAAREEQGRLTGMALTHGADVSAPTVAARLLEAMPPSAQALHVDEVATILGVSLSVARAALDADGLTVEEVQKRRGGTPRRDAGVRRSTLTAVADRDTPATGPATGETAGDVPEPGPLVRGDADWTPVVPVRVGDGG